MPASATDQHSRFQMNALQIYISPACHSCVLDSTSFILLMTKAEFSVTANNIGDKFNFSHSCSLNFMRQEKIHMCNTSSCHIQNI